MRIVILLCLLVSMVSTSSARPCTLGISNEIKFDAKEYVFIGVVTGYTAPAAYKSDEDTAPVSSSVLSERPRNSKEAIGLIVKFEKAVYTPQSPSEYFEVYDFTLWADCSITGTPIDRLAKDYPKGTEVRVVAHDPEYLLDRGAKDRIRLEVRPTENSFISSDSVETKNVSISVDSVFDYEIYNRGRKWGDLDVAMINFEARKDLFRLEQSRSENETKAVLNRLVNISPYISDIDYPKLFDRYLKNKDDIEFYLRLRKKIEKRLMSKQKE